MLAAKLALRILNMKMERIDCQETLCKEEVFICYIDSHTLNQSHRISHAKILTKYPI